MKLERYRGHFLNWYDTNTLAPLLPRYVSTVDSGNLLAHLLTLRQGLLQLVDKPVLSPRVFMALQDTVEVLDSLTVRSLASPIRSLRQVLDEYPATIDLTPQLAFKGLQRIVPLSRALLEATKAEGNEEPIFWAETLQTQTADALAGLCAFLRSEADVDFADQTVHDALPSLAQLAREACPVAQACLDDISRLSAVCQELLKVDYDFLYDDSRRLFAIGYNVSEGRRDNGYYDLLASEARLGVFIAIAQGRIAQESWFSLGRLLTRVEGQPVLLSWSGSMFEYLMPLLVMPLFPNSLLEQTCRAVISRQIEYGKQRSVPWGISESAYNLTDAAKNYQYHAFGVPGLGLQRGLAQELVIAPYATALALHVDPTAAVQNLKRMAGDGWLGRYGFYEAVDFNAKRAPHGQNHAIVRSFMAHHQGMSLLSFAHALLDRPMQRRFTADPQVQATLLLLQERMPRVSGQYASNPALVDLRASSDGEEVSMRIFDRTNTAYPAVQLLSNGRYHVMVTNSGSGYSRYKDMAVTRWREDATCEDSGTFCYIRDCDSNEVWSTSHQPTLATADTYEAIFTDPRVEFRCRNHGIDIHTEIVVSPEDDIELRRSRITNRSRGVRILEITSYAEVVLTQGIADALHPAFSKLFVQTELIPSRDAIICTRRRRDTSEQAPWMFHLLALHGATSIRTSFETDRAAFLGRGNQNGHPQAMQPNGALSNAQGSVLDPVVAIRHRVELQPEQTISIDLVNGVATSRDLCHALIDKYHDQRLADRVIDLVGAHSRAALGQINVSDADAQTFGRAAGHILFPFAPARTDAATIMRNQLNQSHLWAHAISGDLPILLVQINNPDNLELLRQVLLAHAYWRTKGLAVDLVVWNEERSGYRQSLHDAIMGMLASSAEANMIDRPGGIFVRAIEQISNEDRVLMLAVARVVLSDHNGSLIEQLAHREVTPTLVPRLIPVRNGSVMRVSAAEDETLDALLLGNGKGGFSANGRQYVIVSEEGEMTPAPWANVIANEEFGCVVSESSLGYTWMENAHEYRLTPWHNDPVSDRCGEAFYLRDEESGYYWSPTPLPARGNGRYVTRHGFGYTVFDHVEDGISTELQVYVATDAPVKFFTLRVRNQSGQTRKLSATGYVEWVLGDLPAKTGMQVITSLDQATGALFAHNSYSTEFSELVAFFDVDDSERTLSGDRTEFIGRNGSLAHPAALRRARLSGNVGAAMDPCGAIQVPFELADGQSHKLSFRLGAARSNADASALVKRFRVPRSDRAALDAVHELWHRKLDVIQVNTPDPALDVLANGWLLYQVIACRLWGRSGYYQSGGAFGFRDQLQDTMALVHADPERQRSQLLLCASRQFPEGDVQHWWHPPAGRGVRTRCSDDYLWLPLATCRYLRTTHDNAVLDERVGFIDGRQLNPGEESYYDLPMDAGQSADLYTHCVLAIKHGLRMGEHGLPLIGSGDWNDGMNHVGSEGRGESVWLGFFLYAILRDFAPVARERSDEEFAQRCEREADQLRDNLAAHGWDGEWYRRAYFDDGTPLGTATAAECRIDSIAQSWSVLSGAGSSERTSQALDSLQRLLVRREAKLVQLLDPPFDVGEPDPGYIRGYVPGVRENGGQYTHAALWAAMAMVHSGRTETAWELFNLINPVRHSLSPEGRELYKSEPYVVAADVYAVTPHVGRGGWTWYTGSAGWMYRLIVESLLGITREGSHLRIEPQLPADWPGFSASYRVEGSGWPIVVRRSDGAESTGLLLDGVRQPDNRVALVNANGPHTIEVILPATDVGSGKVSGEPGHRLALLPTPLSEPPPA
ncbi:MAG: glucoamylase family protein [Dokdonella sp.]